jgi:hypothetical protein
VATWTEFEAAEPEMAAIARGLLKPAPIMMLATVRRDGAPRVHPVCPIFADGRMYVAVAGEGRKRVPASPKRWDLARDGRYALHGLPGDHDEEFYCAGRATRRTDAATRTTVSAAAGHTIHDVDWLFELDLDRAMTAYWENWTKPDTYAVRRFWHALR